MTSRARLTILAFAVVGLAFASASAYVHYRVITDPTYISPCDLSAKFNCTQVYLSRFGSIRGVPVALGGVIWFALVSLLAGFSRPSPSRASGPAAESSDPIGGYIFALATIGLSAILYLAYASFFILKSGCILCMGTYVCVIGIFIVSGLTTSTTMTRLPIRLFDDLRALISRPATLMITVLFLAGAASVVAFFPKEGHVQTAPSAPLPNDLQTQFAAAWEQQPRVNFGAAPAGAKVVIVKFNDWLCPGCKGFAQAYKPILDKYEKSNPGAVLMVIKDWPWSMTCNFSIQATIHGHEASCEAAVAVRIARDRGKGEEMSAWLFDNQERLVELDLNGTGAQATIKGALTTIAGVTAADFDKLYPAKVVEIKRDIADGGSINVHTTPTFFVNGVRTTDNNTNQNLPPEYLDLAIQIELKKVAGK